jgi:TRAP-type C4-dicarboxylate transport system permease large subunit
MWFGLMMTVNLAIGTITPPVALNLYVAANLAGISMGKNIPTPSEYLWQKKGLFSPAIANTCSF